MGMNKAAVSYVIETTDNKGQTFDGQTFTYAADAYDPSGRDAQDRAFSYAALMAEDNEGFIFKVVKITFMGVKVNSKREVMMICY